MQRDVLSQPIVTYVRVREIFHSFLKWKYGDLPVDLPATDCQLYNIMSVGIAPNYKMKRMCYSSFSMSAYDAVFKTQNGNDLFSGITENVYLPKESEQKKLIPFILPQTVILGGRRCNTDKWYQFSDKSFKEFSRQIESEFWAAYIKHDQKFNLYCYRTGKIYNQELSMERFMFKIGMDLNMEETFARYWRKKKSADKKMFDHYTNKDSTRYLQSMMESGGSDYDF